MCLPRPSSGAWINRQGALRGRVSGFSDKRSQRTNPRQAQPNRGNECERRWANLGRAFRREEGRKTQARPLGRAKRREIKGFFLPASLDDAHPLLRSDSGALRVEKWGSGIFPYSPERGHMKWRVRIPPARVSVFYKDFFALKRLQRDGGVVGLGGSLRNRYRDGGYHLIFSSFFFFLRNFRGGAISTAIRLKNQSTPVNSSQ